MAISVIDARKSDAGRVELRISASPMDVAGYLTECEESIGREGGIIPDGQRSTLVARFGEERLQKLTDEWLMDRIGTETLGASENPLVGFHQFFLEKNEYPDGPLVFQAVSYELPKGTLSSVEPLELGPEAMMPKESEIDRSIKSLMRAYAAQRVSNEKRPVKLGDTVRVDIDVTAGGVPVTSMRKHSAALKLDYTTMPVDFIDQVVGMSPGEEKEFPFTVPAIEGVCDEEHFDAKVALKALYFIDEPKLTPKWIQGKFPGLKNENDLRNAMAQNLAQRAGGLPNKEDAMDAVLFERLDVDVPDEMIEFVYEGIRRAEAKRIHESGMGLDEYCAANGMTVEEFDQNLRITAERDLKLSIALDAVYAAKEFTLMESDIDMIFEQMAPGRGSEMKYGYIMSGRLHEAEEIAQRAKARRWLHETAKLAR